MSSVQKQTGAELAPAGHRPNVSLTGGYSVAAEAILPLVLSSRKSIDILTLAFTSKLHDYRSISRAVEQRNVRLRVLVQDELAAVQSSALTNLRRRLSGTSLVDIRTVTAPATAQVVLVDRLSFWFGDETDGRGTLVLNDRQRGDQLASRFDLHWQAARPFNESRARHPD